MLGSASQRSTRSAKSGDFSAKNANQDAKTLNSDRSLHLSGVRGPGLGAAADGGLAAVAKVRGAADGIIKLGLDVDRGVRCAGQMSVGLIDCEIIQEAKRDYIRRLILVLRLEFTQNSMMSYLPGSAPVTGTLYFDFR